MQRERSRFLEERNVAKFARSHDMGNQSYVFGEYEKEEEETEEEEEEEEGEETECEEGEETECEEGEKDVVKGEKEPNVPEIVVPPTQPLSPTSRPESNGQIDSPPSEMLAASATEITEGAHNEHSIPSGNGSTRRKRQHSLKITRDIKKTDETVLQELMQELDAFKRLELALPPLESDEEDLPEIPVNEEPTEKAEIEVDIKGEKEKEEKEGLDIPSLPIANKRMLASGELRDFRKLRLSDDVGKESLNKSWREELSASWEGAEEVRNTSFNFRVHCSHH